MKKITLLFTVLMFSTVGFAQCINASAYGTLVVANNGTVEAITTDSYTEEYAELSSVIIGNDYVFTCEETGPILKYITVTDVTDTVIAFGMSPLTVNAITATDIRVHFTEDAACTTGTGVNHVTTIQCISVSCVPPPGPANDDCSNAIALACSSLTATDTSLATLDTDDVLTCGPASAAGNIWYTYTGSGSAENIELSMCNDTGATPGDAAYDSKIYVYASGDGTCGTLVCEANNDDGAGCASFSSIVNFTSDGTTTYYIAISGYNTTVGTGNLSVTCTLAVSPNVANQDCGTALAMAVDGIAVGTDNGNGTINIGNPTCDGFGTIQDVWFSFVAPVSGTVTVDTILDGTATDANFVVYSGTCGTLTEVATSCQDVATSANTIDLTGLSGTYYVQAWNGGAAEEGTFSLRLSDTSLGIEDLRLAEGFNIFPNPFKDKVTVSAKNEIKELSVVNMLGQTVKTVSPNSRDYQLDLSNLTSGIYFVKARVNNSEGTFRIVKE